MSGAKKLHVLLTQLLNHRAATLSEVSLHQLAVAVLSYCQCASPALIGDSQVSLEEGEEPSSLTGFKARTFVFFQCQML